ncbi:MAG: ferritin-like domain-containing protein, partial [Alphaproteobacteria bacterium]|nr:ferritin-like domain-containing protein [Alphaproteobacteria bacterium]
VETFEPVIHEEGRHILFYVNWVAWHRRNMPLWRRPWFELKVLAVWAFLIWERIGIASNLDHGVQDNNFTVSGAEQLGVELKPAELMDLCLAENDRRLSAYDLRLLRPRFIPAMVRIARRFMR